MGKPGRGLRTTTAVLAGLLVLAACDAGAPTPPRTRVRPAEPVAPLTGTRWTVNALRDADVSRPLPDGTAGKAHLVFGKDGQVQGSAGCNAVGGAAVVSEEGHTITFGVLGSTRMMCDGPAMELERAVLDVLKGTVGYRVEHRTLILTATPGGKGLSASAN
ncbi:META domain-containing protein [Streptomyces sp. SDr-06]|uniref:META domain-containing protein n=1 Tax=Streptomyces sp. SDr-06 TaxID=2267702 RepID=UPI000DE870C3|nr:META domain-containing protein [Streptomyces sp. SDr-06]RCH61947.1 META domain-containing protein [Streptomyces sp. SDr-06]